MESCNANQHELHHNAFGGRGCRGGDRCTNGYGRYRFPSVLHQRGPESDPMPDAQQRSERLPVWSPRHALSRAGRAIVLLSGPLTTAVADENGARCLYLAWAHSLSWRLPALIYQSVAVVWLRICVVARGVTRFGGRIVECGWLRRPETFLSSCNATSSTGCVSQRRIGRGRKPRPTSPAIVAEVLVAVPTNTIIPTLFR